MTDQSYNYSADHDLLVALNTKMDMVITSLSSKADKAELAALKENYNNLEARCSKQWYWILGIIGAALMAAGGALINLLVRTITG